MVAEVSSNGQSGTAHDALVDLIALNLFGQLRGMSACDRRFVLVELDGRIHGASSERVVLARSAVQLFERETTGALSRTNYERWRVARPDAQVLPSAKLIENTWLGSWSTAMDRLGFRPGACHAVRTLARRGVEPGSSELLERLQACASELGRTPSLDEFDRWRRAQLLGRNGVIVVGVPMYQRRFGGWRQAIEAAGLPQRERARRVPVLDWTRDDAIRCLREATAAHGTQRLRMVQYEEWRGRHIDLTGGGGIPGGDSIVAEFGGWLAALVAAGLLSQNAAQNVRVGQGRAFSDDELDSALACFARETDGPDSSGAYERWRVDAMSDDGEAHVPGRKPLARRHGSWARVAARIREHRTAAAHTSSSTVRPAMASHHA